jgi:hypothetical protein
MAYFAERHPEYGTGEAKWSGSCPGLWSSSFWEEYKLLRTEQAKGTDQEFDYTQCSNTNIAGKPDEAEFVVRQPHLKKG